MKTIVLKITVAFCILVSVFTVNAQVSVNVKHGIVASTLSKLGDLGDNNHISLSYTAGAFVIVPLSGTLSVQPELNYVKKGRSEEFDVLGATNKAKLSADYLQVPLLVRYSPVGVFGESKTRLFLNTGLYESILLHSEKKIITGNELTGENQTKSYKDTDFGVVFGGGVQFPVKQFLVQLELRYDMGITKVTNMSDNYATKALSLSMGVKF